MSELINSLGKDGLKLAYTLIQYFALYLTVAIILVLVIAYLVLKLKKSEKLNSFKTFTGGLAIGYAITLCSVVVFLMVARMNLKAELTTNYFLVLGLFIVLLLYAVSSLICSLVSKKALKINNCIGLAICCLYTVALVFIIPTESPDYQPLSKIGMYSFSIVLVLVITLLAILFGKDNGYKNQTKVIAYAGVSISLSFALSFVKFFTMGANGGSITFASLLPLMIFSYCFGARKGLYAGIIYGVLQFLQNPQMYQAMQVMLDYPIAFGAIGLAGMFKDVKLIKSPALKFALGALVAVALRYVAHVLSGYYVFSSWAWEGYSALAYSVVYNSFCFVDLAVLLFPAIAMFSSKAFTRQLEQINPKAE